MNSRGERHRPGPSLSVRWLSRAQRDLGSSSGYTFAVALVTLVSLTFLASSVHASPRAALRSMASLETSRGFLPADGKLDSLRQETRGGGKGKDAGDDGRRYKPPQGERDRPHESEQSGEEESLTSAIAVILVKFVVMGPFCIPHEALDDNLHHQGHFAGAPYLGHPGYGSVVYDPDQDPSAMGRTYFGVGGVEWSHDRGSVSRTGARLRLEGPYRFGIEARGSYLREHLARGGTDEVGVVVADLLYRFAQGEHAQFRAGAGCRALLDRGWSTAGVDFVYGLELFPAKPYAVSLSIAGGTLGSTTVVEPRATLGAVFRAWEVDVGYAGLRIGHVDLGGPVVELRRWY